MKTLPNNIHCNDKTVEALQKLANHYRSQNQFTQALKMESKSKQINEELSKQPRSKSLKMI